MNDERQRLLDIIRRRYSNVYHSHKAHEKERERASKRANSEKWLRIGLTCFAALTICFEAVSSKTHGAIFAAVIGAISLAYSIYRLSTSPERRAHSHTIAAKQLRAERDNLENLIEECMSTNSSIPDIRAKRDVIVQRINAIDLPTPYASNAAYKEGAKSLSPEGGEVSTRTEIDSLLPESLRLGESGNSNSESADVSGENYGFS